MTGADSKSPEIIKGGLEEEKKRTLARAVNFTGRTTPYSFATWVVLLRSAGRRLPARYHRWERYAATAWGRIQDC